MQNRKGSFIFRQNTGKVPSSSDKTQEPFQNIKEPFQNVIVIGGKVPCQKSFSEEPFLVTKERLKYLSLVILEPFFGDLGTFP